MPDNSQNQNSNPQSQIGTQTVILKPKLLGFLLAYIFFSIPSFIISILGVFLMFTIVSGAIAGIALAQSGLGNSNSNIASNLNLISTNNSTNQEGVLIYSLKGGITSSTYNPYASEEGIFVDKVKDDFELIKKDGRIKNVVFKLDTPGGEVYASEILSDLITDLQKSYKSKEAVFYFDQIVASGGLWATYKTPNNYVVGSKYGEAGSIGVVLSLPNFQGLAQKVGYEETVFKSSPEKDLGNPLRDLSETEKKFFQDRINNSYEKFKGVIKTGRNLNSTQVDKIATGFITPNAELVEAGLVNEIGDIEIATSRSAKNAGLGDGHSVWKIETESGFLDRLFQVASSNLPGSQLTGKIDSKFSLKSGVTYAIEESLL